MASAEARRSARFPPSTPTPAVDVMWDKALGFVQDLSSGGIRLLADAPLVDGGLYQLQWPLETGARQPRMLEAGVQVVSQHRVGGGTLAGMRFIHLPEADARVLAQWLEARAGAA